VEKKETHLKVTRRDFLKTSVASAGLLYASKLGLFRPESRRNSEEAPTVEILHLNEKWKGFIKTDKTPVFLIPLAKDYFYDEAREIETAEFSNQTISCKNFWYLLIDKKVALTLTELPHTTGDASLPLAILTNPPMQKSPEKIISAYTYTGESGVYRNKIYNIATTAASIMRFQEKHGPFEKGKTYSYLEMIDLIHNQDYRSGYNDAREVVRGGGICAGSTTLAKALLLSGSKLVEKWPHPTRVYWVGPGDPAITVENSDATTGYGDDGQVYDLKFIPSQTFYLDIDLAITPNGTKVDDFHAPADARVTFTVKATPTKPESDKSAKMFALRDTYYKEAKTNPSAPERDPLPKGLDNLEGQNELEGVVYPQERISHFEKELKENSSLVEIDEIRNVLNSYVLTGQKEVKVGSYLRNSDWYKKFVDSGRDVSKVENILRILDKYTNYFYQQPFQCGTYTALLASLVIPLSPRNIFEYTLDDGGYADFVSQLVPYEIKSGQSRLVNGKGFTFKVIDKLSEVNVGNLFVRYEDKVGHIGAVVGKKVLDNGEVVLLVTDANRRKGKVFVFEVDALNFNAIFGCTPYKKVVIY